MGVRGRNSDNTLIRQQLGWAPLRPLREGLEKTYRWVDGQVQPLCSFGLHLLYHRSGSESGARTGEVPVKILVTGGAGFTPSSYATYFDDGVETAKCTGVLSITWRRK
jgi:dTDP-D-glucose 4,6-dehydratase